MPKVIHPQGEINFEVHGRGEPVVLIGGLGRTVDYAHDFRNFLARNYQVITLDVRGIGQTTVKIGLTDSIFDFAEDVMLVLDQLRVSSAHFIGSSLGGMISLAAAIDHPQRCRSLSILNSSVAGHLIPRLTLPAVSTLIFGSFVLRHMMPGMLVDILTGEGIDEEQRSELVLYFDRLQKTEGLHVASVIKQSLCAARFHVRKRLSHVQQPTQIIYGTHDRFVPNTNSKILAELIPHAQLIPIQGGGHELTLGAENELYQRVADWIGGESHVPLLIAG